MADDYIARLERTLTAHGIRDYSLERTRRHRRIVIATGGRRIAAARGPQCRVGSSSPVKRGGIVPAGSKIIDRDSAHPSSRWGGRW
jgi:hypothetical protein